MTYQQTCISHIALQGGAFLIQSQSDIRGSRVIADVYHPWLSQPEKWRFILPITSLIANGSQPELLLMFAESRRNLLENCFYLDFVAYSILLDVCLIKRKDISLNHIHFHEIMGFYIFENSLRHTSHYHIMSEVIHYLAMQWSQSLLFLITITDERHHLLISHCP